MKYKPGSAYGGFVDVTSIYAGGSNQKSEGGLGILEGAESLRNGRDEGVCAITAIVDY